MAICANENVRNNLCIMVRGSLKYFAPIREK